MPVDIIRYHRTEFNALKHLVIPLLGTILVLFPLWGLIQPGQPAPFNLFPAITGVFLVVCIVYGVILALRSSNLADRIGSYVADDSR